jgi:hypothetical protein
MLRAGLDTGCRGGLDGATSAVVRPTCVSFHAAAAIAILLLTACGDKPMPVVTTIDTLCTVTTRYHATDAQRAAFKADPDLWESLVDWMLGFNKERDKRCLKPSGTP